MLSLQRAVESAKSYKEELAELQMVLVKAKCFLERSSDERLGPGAVGYLEKHVREANKIANLCCIGAVEVGDDIAAIGHDVVYALWRRSNFVEPEGHGCSGHVSDGGVEGCDDTEVVNGVPVFGKTNNLVDPELSNGNYFVKYLYEAPPHYRWEISKSRGGLGPSLLSTILTETLPVAIFSWVIHNCLVFMVGWIVDLGQGHITRYDNLKMWVIVVTVCRLLLVYFWPLCWGHHRVNAVYLSKQAVPARGVGGGGTCNILWNSCAWYMLYVQRLGLEFFYALLHVCGRTLDRGTTARALRGKTCTSTSPGAMLWFTAAAGFMPGVAAAETFGDFLEPAVSALLRWLCYAPASVHALIVTLAAVIVYKSIVFSIGEMKAVSTESSGAWREPLQSK
eukprot:g5367.t1